LGAGALAWDLSATRAAEALTKAGLMFNPLSAPALEQLMGILREIQRHSTPSKQHTAVLLEKPHGENEEPRSNYEEEDQEKIKKGSSEDRTKTRIQSLYDYVTWIKGSTGYACNDACQEFEAERWTRWPALSKRTAALWWRCDELKLPKHGVGVDRENYYKERDDEEKVVNERSDPMGKEVSMNSDHTYAALLVEEMAASCVPIRNGERDAVDELLWLLDTEDTAPLMTLLESSPFRSEGSAGF